MFRFDEAFRREFRENWLLLVTAFSCMLFGLSSAAGSMPFLYPELIAEFGWSREQVMLYPSTKYAFATFGAIFFGLAIDRLGVWFSLLFLMSLSGVAMAIWLWMHSLSVYYLSAALGGVAIGGGAISIKILVSRALHRSQGTAMGVVLMGTALAATLIPIIISFLISTFGWRNGFAAMSLSIWLFVIPLLVWGYFYSKRQPVTAHSVPDMDRGALSGSPAGDQKAVLERVRGYLRNRNFWFIGVAAMISSVIDSGFYQNMVLILKDLSLEPATVVSLVSIIGMIGIGARLVSGNILDSRSNKGLAGLYLALLLTCLAAPFLSVPLILGFFMLARPLGQSVVLLDDTVMIKHSFGNTKDLGILFSLMYIFTHIGSAVGPWFMGRVFDAAGSYNFAYAIYGGLAIVAALAAYNIKPEFWLAMNRKKAEGDQVAANVPSIAADPHKA